MDVAQAAVELSEVVTRYMLGEVDGGDVSRAQAELRTAQAAERSLERGRQGVAVTWSDNGVVVQCHRRACEVRRDGRSHWWDEEVPGAYPSLSEVATVFDAHAAVHRGEGWDG